MPVPSENEPKASPHEDRKDEVFEIDLPETDSDGESDTAEIPAPGQDAPGAAPESAEERPRSYTEDFAVEVQSPSSRARQGHDAASDMSSSKPGWLARVFGARTKRDTQIQALQSGYFEMVEMMRSIRNHLDHQVDTQRQLAASLRDLPDAVSSLRDVGKMTAQQTEVLGLVRDQLERNADHEKAMVSSMEGFNTTLNHMDQTSRDTTRTVSSLVERSHASEASLRAMMERSEKRMATLTGFMSFLALGAVAFALYVVLARSPADSGGREAEVASSFTPVPATDLASADGPAAGADDQDAPPATADDDTLAADDAPVQSEAAEAPDEDALAAMSSTDAATEEAEAEIGEEAMASPASPGAEAAMFLESADETVPGRDDAESQAGDGVLEAPGSEETAVQPAAFQWLGRSQWNNDNQSVDEMAASVDALLESASQAAKSDAVAPQTPESAEPQESADEDVAEPESAAPQALETSTDPAEGDPPPDLTSEDGSERPGIQGVVRRVFSFLGEERDASAPNPGDSLAAAAEHALIQDASAQP